MNDARGIRCLHKHLTAESGVQRAVAAGELGAMTQTGGAQKIL